jgi:hypothetical protein
MPVVAFEDGLAFTLTPLPEARAEGEWVAAKLGTSLITGTRATEAFIRERLPCGLTAAGAAWCWGDNNRGGLGDGTIVSRSTPGAVLGGHVFTTLTVGGTHACGLEVGGAA